MNEVVPLIDVMQRANTNGHDDEFDYGEAFDQGRLPAGATKPKGRVEDPVGLASGKVRTNLSFRFDLKK